MAVVTGTRIRSSCGEPVTSAPFSSSTPMTVKGAPPTNNRFPRADSPANSFLFTWEPITVTRLTSVMSDSSINRPSASGRLLVSCSSGEVPITVMFTDSPPWRRLKFFIVIGAAIATLSSSRMMASQSPRVSDR